MISMRGKTILFIAVLLLTCPVGAQRPFFDRTHPSKVIGEARNYRIFLPPDVRYGTERLYQAFQLHNHYLHRYELVVLGKP